MGEESLPELALIDLTFFVSIFRFHLLYFNKGSKSANNNKKCGVSPISCGLEAQYASQIMTIAIHFYATSCLAIFNVMMKILVTVQRIFIIKNKKYFERVTPVYPIRLLAILSFAYLPVIFSKKVACTHLVGSNMTCYMS